MDRYSRQVLWDSPNTDLRSDVKSLAWNYTPWYTLICINFRVIPVSDWTSVLKAQLLQNHYATTTPKMSSWALNGTHYAHTPGSSHLPKHTQQSKGVIQRELALMPHIIWGDRVLIGQKVRLEGSWIHFTDLSLLYSPSLCLPFSASTITRAALYKLMTLIRTDSTVTSHQ